MQEFYQGFINAFKQFPIPRARFVGEIVGCIVIVLIIIGCFCGFLFGVLHLTGGIKQ